MPNVYKPKLLQIRAQYDPNTDSNDHPENIFWFQSSAAGTPTVSQLHAICNAMDALWAPVWAQVGSTSKHYVGCTTTDWSGSFGQYASSVGTYTPQQGSATGVCMPAQVASLISWSNGERFKGGHFRTYLPWIGSSALDGTDKNKISSTTQTNLYSALANWLSGMLATGQLGGQTQMLYRHRNNITTAALYQVSEYSVPLMLATQRRRLRRAAHS